MNATAKIDGQVISPQTELSDDDQYLTFHLSNEMFAVGILNIKEIIEYGHLTTVPMMPEFVRGVINLRGSVVPVIDLQARFGRKSSVVGKRTCIVIVEVVVYEQIQTIGIIVDAVSAVISIPGSDIEKAPEFGAKLRTDFIFGMGKIEDEFVIILNIGQVLSINEMLSLVEKIDLSNSDEQQHLLF